ncbi:MAG: hypothetical protein ABSC53_03460 [Bacteroidota bacterium]
MINPHVKVRRFILKPSYTWKGDKRSATVLITQQAGTIFFVSTVVCIDEKGVLSIFTYAGKTFDGVLKSAISTMKHRWFTTDEFGFNSSKTIDATELQR